MIGFLICITIIAIALTAVIFARQIATELEKSARVKQRTRNLTKYTESKPPETPTAEQLEAEIPEHLFNRLLELTQNRDYAIRGILLTMKDYPRETATWACTKEIRDIQNLIASNRQTHTNSKKDRDTDRYL